MIMTNQFIISIVVITFVIIIIYVISIGFALILS